MKSFSDDIIANVKARDLSRSDPAAYRKKIDKCVSESLRCVHINEPGCTAKFVEDNLCHEALRDKMKEQFKDPASISRVLILDLVKKAQEIGEEKENANIDSLGQIKE